MSNLQLLSTTAVVCTIALFATNFGPIRAMQLSGHVGSTNYVPFLTQLANCILWTRYGVVQGDVSVTVVNLVGTLIALYALLQFYTFSNTDGKDKLEQWMLMVCLALFLTLLGLRWTGNVELLGFLAAGGSILLFASPLSALREVLRTRSVASMNGAFVLLGCIVSGLWALYGKKLQDNFIFVPNFIGCLLSIAQGILFLRYQGSSRSMDPRGLPL